MPKRWIWRIIETVCFGAFGHGILLFLESRNIHLDRMVAAMIDQAANLEVSSAVRWSLIGAFGLAATMILNVSGIERKLRQWWRATPTIPANEDYDHSLALQDVRPSLDLGNIQNTLEIRLYLRNAAPGPLQYNIESYEATFGGVSVTSSGGGSMAKDGTSIFFPNRGFDKATYRKWSSRVIIIVDFSIVYGHPSRENSRRMTRKIQFNLFKKAAGKKVEYTWIVLAENDGPIER